MGETTGTDLVNHGLISLKERDNGAAIGAESTIIVTGVARGGTSMLAQVLDRMGLFLGDKRDPMVVEDTEILGALQASDRGQLDNIIANRNQRFLKWGFKVPNLHSFLTLKDERRFRNPRYVVVFRDPVAIARRNELSMQEDSAQAICSASENMAKLSSYVCALDGPALLISYEKALQNTEHVVEAVSTFCGLSPNSEQKAAALAAITPNDPAYIFATQVVYWGQVDNIRGETLRGWCCYKDSAEVVAIEVFANEKSIGIFPAGDYREDLKNTGFHQGVHAFNLDLAIFDIPPHSTIWVRPAGRQLTLPNSGLSVEELRQRR